MIISGQRIDRKEKQIMSLAFLRPVVEVLAEMHRSGRVYGKLGPESVVVREHVWFAFPLSQETEYTYRDKEMSGNFVTLAEPEDSDRDNRKSPYVPLEQMLDVKRETQESDVYSLCAILYQMITGIEPPDARERISGAVVKSPSELGADISSFQEKVLLRGLALMEKDRYADAAELYLDLYGENGSKEVESVDFSEMQETRPDSAKKQYERSREEYEVLGRLVSVLQVRLKTLEKDSEYKIQSQKNQKNVLRHGWRNSVKFGKKVLRIVFLDTAFGCGKQAWDVSEKRDGSVMAWLKKRGGILDRCYDLYIGAEGGVSAPEDSSYLFAGFKGLEELNFQGNFDTSNVRNMKGMFFECSSIRTMDIDCFDTSQVTDMSYMFSCCKGVRYLNVAGFDTSRVTTMRGMFSTCPGLVRLDVGGFDTSKVTDMCFMFSGCRSLKKLDINGFDTSKVMDMCNMFANCECLTYLNVDNFDTSQVKSMKYMFWGCNGLASLDISHLDLSCLKHGERILPNHLCK